MKTSPTQRFALCFILVLAFAGWTSSTARAQCTTTWTNAAGGSWTVGTNWDSGVPDAADDACITLDATYTVTLSTAATVNSLTLGVNSGTNTQTLTLTSSLNLTTASTIEADGVLDWQVGFIGGAGGLTNMGLLAMSGAGLKELGASSIITNEALTTFDGTGSLRFNGNFSLFTNAATGTFDIQSDADFSHFNGANVFTNDGLVQKSGGAVSSIVSTTGLAFNNNGTVDAQSGTIQFDGLSGTHNNGMFTASAGAEVFFASGTHTVVGTISGNPLGVVRMDAGTTLVDDGSGATIDFGGTGFEWQSGIIAGTLTNVNLLRLTTAGTKELGASSALTNEGLVDMTDAGVFRFNGNNSLFNNEAGATFDIRSDADFGHFNGSGNVFTNDGLLQKSSGTDISIVSTTGLAFNNNGTVDAQTGTIQMDGVGTHDTGVFTASLNAQVFFNSGTHIIVGTVSGNPAGAVRMDGGATLVDDTFGATIDFGGTGFEWQSGIFAGDLTNVDLLRLTTVGTKELGASSALTNEGLVEMTDAGVFRFNGNFSVFTNGAAGTFDIQSDADLGHFNATGNVFTNDGLLQKTGGTDVSIVSTTGLAFNNNGTVDALTGTIQFDGSGTHDNGEFTASLTALVFFNAGTHTIVGMMSGDPDGVVRLDAGATLVDDGSGASIDFGGTGFEWQSGNFAGDLTNMGLLSLATAGTKDINGESTLTNEGLVEMPDTGLLRWVGNNSVFTNAATGTFDIQSNADFGHFNASGNVFTNEGLLRKSGGGDISVVSTVGLAFNNNGTVEAQTSTIQFDGGGTHTNGEFVASAGAEVYFNAGAHTIVGVATGNPVGVVRMDAGVTLAGDMIDFGGTGFEWQSGNMGTITNAGLLRLTTTGLKDLNGVSTLTNEGLVEMTDSGTLRFVGNNSVFANAAAGTFDMQSDADFSHFNATGNTFTNAGLFQKTGGTGASVVSTSALAFNNNAGGVVSAESGTIDVDGTFVHSAGALVQGTATFDKGASFTHNGDTGPGTSPGILNWLGTWAPTGGASHLNIEIAGNAGAGNPDGHDQLAATGAASVADSVIVSHLGGFEPSFNDAYTILTGSSVAGTFAGIEAPVGFAYTPTYNAADVVITATSVPPVIASLTGDTSGDEGDLFSFMATANDPDGGSLTYTWNWGDSSPDSVGVDIGNVSHTYVDDGVYTIVLTVVDDELGSAQGMAVDSLTVTVGNVNPTITDLSGDTVGNEGDTFDFTASATDPGSTNDPLTYTWNYGDGSGDDVGIDLTAVSHVYATAGAYILTLTVADDDGGSTMQMLNITVNPLGLVASAEPVSPPVVIPAGGGAFEFTATISNFTANPAALDMWFAITGPMSVEPLQNTIRQVNVNAGESKMKTFRIRIPAVIMDGAYTFTVKFGTFPGTVDASDSFGFTKEAPAALAGRGVEQNRARGQRSARVVTDIEGLEVVWEEENWTVTALVAAKAATEITETEGAKESAEESVVADAPATAHSESLPTEYALQAAYPNPFTTQATLRYDLPEAAHVRVVVYDLLGREVARPVDNDREAGRHSALFDGRTLASGVYVVRMTVGDRAFTHRITLLR